MSSFPAGAIPLTGAIGTTGASDTFPTHYDYLGYGGDRGIDTIANMYAISTDRRQWGMKVTVYADPSTSLNRTYILSNAINGGVDNDIANNANWKQFGSSPFLSVLTSVGLCMPPAFTVTSSPLTSNGNICVAGAGGASQYVRGDGVLGNFPQVSGGGGGVSLYMNGGTSEGTIGGQPFEQLSRSANTGAAANFTAAGAGNQLIANFITDAGQPNETIIPPGAWSFQAYFSLNSAVGTPNVYTEVYKYNGASLTLIATSSNVPIVSGTLVDFYTWSVTMPSTTLLSTDRIAIKIYANTLGANTITLYTQGSHLASVLTTFSTGISALNGLTCTTQYFQCGTAGNDFSICSVVDTHTFNLPSASAANRGLLTCQDWATFNNKLTSFSTCTATTGLQLLPSVVCTGQTVLCVNASTASTTCTGLLSSTDWNTFNNKITSFAVVGSGGICVSPATVCNGNTLCICNSCAYTGQAVIVLDSGTGSSVRCGNSNCASGNYSTVSGGCKNTGSGTYASVAGGGLCNIASGYSNTVVGGNNNLGQAVLGFIGGGICNNVCNATSGCLALGAVVVGGVGNNTTGGTWDLPSCSFTVAPTKCNAGIYSFIGGGFQNIVKCDYGFSGGGQANVVAGCHSAIAGGNGNLVTGNCSFVGSGCGHCNSAFKSFIGGGDSNKIIGNIGTIGGGSLNCVGGSSSFATIAGGQGIFINSTNGSVVGGQNNIIYACSNYSFIGGGCANSTCGCISVVAGGWLNSIGGQGDAITGGICNSTAVYTYACTGAVQTISACVSPNVCVAGNVTALFPANAFVCMTGGSTCLNKVIASTFSTYTTICLQQAYTGTYTSIQGFTEVGSKNSHIGGGCCNFNCCVNSVIGGGVCNFAQAGNSFIGGGTSNYVCNSTDACLAYGAVVVGGIGNNTTGGVWNQMCCTFTTLPTIWNAGKMSFVGGGLQNRATGNFSSVTGGYTNTASGIYSFIGSGFCNIANGSCSTIGGGRLNCATDLSATVGGGAGNCAINRGAGVATGYSNTASGYASVIAGGQFNAASGNRSAVSGGLKNTASGTYSAILGGCCNLSQSFLGFIGGGICNNVCNATSGCLALGAVVVGGVGNNTTGGTWSLATCSFTVSPTICNAGQYSFVGGGFQNASSGCYSGITGGNLNTASGAYSNISGGTTNISSGISSGISGGSTNTSSGNCSHIGGGKSNTASSCYSAILGGSGNAASGAYSGAFGCNLTASAPCTFYVNNLCACGCISGLCGYITGATDTTLSQTGTTLGLNLGNANTWTGQQTFNTSAPKFGTMTSGSVLFAGASGVLSQDNSNLFWDATNHRLGVGTAAPSFSLHIYKASTPALEIQSSGALAYLGISSANGDWSDIDVANDLVLRNSAKDLILTARNTTGNIYFATGAPDTAKMTILNGGNVGIATTSPAALLSLGTAGTKAGTLSMAGATSGTATIQTAAAAGTPTLTLPTSTGTFALTSDIPTSFYLGTTSIALNRASGSQSLTGISIDGSAGSVANALSIAAELHSGGATSFNGNSAISIGIQASSVTNGMLAGSIAASKLIGTDITTVGTLSSGSIPYSLLTGTPSSLAPTSGSTFYIQNGTTQQASSNFNISGAGVIGTTLTVGGLTTITDGSTFRTRLSASAARIDFVNYAQSAYVAANLEALNLNLNVFTGNPVTVGGTLDVAGAATFSSCVTASSSICGLCNLQIGSSQSASGTFASIAGGASNTASGNCSFIGGGFQNTASAKSSSVIGGLRNTASGCYSFIGGGLCNTASGQYSTLSGGYENTVSGNYSNISGGLRNCAICNYTTVSGGYGNCAFGPNSVVVGGQSNCAMGSLSAITGGGTNKASGAYSFIGAGLLNTASGNYSGILAGQNSTVSHVRSFIIGSNLTSGAACTTYTNALSKASGTFRISHPDPAKNSSMYLQHSFVESPTRGDNIYRWAVCTCNCYASIALPDYYSFLNENDQVWVTGANTFGQAYGIIDETKTSINIISNKDGCYNVLVIGTRCDVDAKNGWLGVEVYK